MAGFLQCQVPSLLCLLSLWRVLEIKLNRREFLKKHFRKFRKLKNFLAGKIKIIPKSEKSFSFKFRRKTVFIEIRRRRTKSRNQRKGLFLKFSIIEKILSFLNNIWWKTEKQFNTDQPFQAHRYSCSAILIQVKDVQCYTARSNRLSITK